MGNVLDVKYLYNDQGNKITNFESNFGPCPFHDTDKDYQEKEGLRYYERWSIKQKKEFITYNTEGELYEIVIDNS